MDETLIGLLLSIVIIIAMEFAAAYMDAQANTPEPIRAADEVAEAAPSNELTNTPEPTRAAGEAAEAMLSHEPANTPEPTRAADEAAEAVPSYELTNTLVYDVLEFLFTYIVYPLIVIAVFVIIIGLIVATVMKADSIHGMIRRTTGAILPIIILTFVVIGTETSNLLEDVMDNISPPARSAIGFAVGFTLIGLGRLIGTVPSSWADRVGSIYSMFLSAVVTIMLWAFMGGGLPMLSDSLLGFILGGGLSIIFIGPPDIFSDEDNFWELFRR